MGRNHYEMRCTKCEHVWEQLIGDPSICPSCGVTQRVEPMVGSLDSASPDVPQSAAESSEERIEEIEGILGFKCDEPGCWNYAEPGQVFCAAHLNTGPEPYSDEERARYLRLKDEWERLTGLQYE